MKKLFAVLMLFMLAVFAGCLTSSSDDDSSNTGDVCGYVTTVDGTGIKYVSMTLSESDGTAVSTSNTNAYGYYVFSDISNGTYTVTLSKSGYTFTPTSVRNVVVNGSDVTVQTIIGATTY